MELGHLFTGHAILVSSLIATITITESTRYASSLRYITELPFIKVAGERGAVLLLFAISIIVLIAMDFLASQAKVSGLKKFYRRAKKAKTAHVERTLITFITFICAYIFQSLNFRTYNLLGIALLMMNLNTLLYLFEIEFVKAWLYLSFLFCNTLVLCFTFIYNAEKYYSIVVSLISIRF
ncbi:uncharacterized protein VICG_01220 [Vittaforma corneae ATCC 50505]|uniref:Uncharacterized protein n=1 Tax=Vittaforma corneae (strain ATCC 50505) TaxID=993615 RepID=L2GLJ3_VITCO|nr:uncharacterized protein VICG_01220 [Vittaforma corneae ATCC 50505]ELA41716.1 hypothetical protein VICG_01220 [Vittaforma corneae ATCC 50505]